MSERVNSAAVVGYPIGHSLSPTIFRLLSKKTGTPVDYQKLSISPRSFDRVIRAASVSNRFRGWNVTLPHKEEAFRNAHILSPVAKKAGAVNVIRFRRGRIEGHNTDVYGVRETLKRRKFRSRGKKAVVFGAGGAASAVVLALGLEGIREIVIVNRTPPRARSLAKKMKKAFPRSKFRVGERGSIPRDADLYVNATPIGMSGVSGKLKLPQFEKPALVFDLIYRPLDTSLLKEARRRGADTVNGLEMLVAQAIATWEIWFGKLPRNLDRHRLTKSIRQVLERSLR